MNPYQKPARSKEEKNMSRLNHRCLLLLVPFILWPILFPRICVGEEALLATLDNGLRLVVVPNRLAPVVTTEINYLAGSNEAPAQLTAIYVSFSVLSANRTTYARFQIVLE